MGRGRLGFGRQVWLRDRRIHHGLTGVALVIAGVIFIADDWHDRWWIPVKRVLT